jgi:DNA-binding NarL/FixJ family response regulator
MPDSRPDAFALGALEELRCLQYKHVGSFDERRADLREHCGGSVLVVDDDSGSRELMSSLLHQAGFSTLSAKTGEEAIAAMRRSRPDLVLLDVRLPGLSGYEICRQLRDEFGEDVAIVFVSGERTDDLDRTAGLLVGADDYVVKPFSPDELLARVRRRIGASPSAGGPNGTVLTRREQQVLRLLAEGRGQKEIAAELVISSKTVGAHIQHILGKLDVHSRAQAVAQAYRRGLLGANGAPG